VTRDPVVIWTANAFALLGLGSLLVIVELLVRRLRYLDETIAVILGFVGIKILAADLVHISDFGSLAIIAALLAGGTVASLVADRLDPPRPVQEATRRPPRCPRELTLRHLLRAVDKRRRPPVRRDASRGFRVGSSSRAVRVSSLARTRVGSCSTETPKTRERRPRWLTHSTAQA
jgi:hypothetical protein